MNTCTHHRINISGLASNNGDRISNLHPSVLSHILSRLPTLDAVRTSILSRYWRYAWTYSYNVDICVRRLSRTVINLMDSILFFPRNLRSFRLKFWNNGAPMRTWISKALTHNLEIFEVDAYTKCNGIIFPSSLLCSTSLRELGMRCYGCTLNVGEKNCVPNLTTLHLTGAEIVCGNKTDTSSTVTFTFPVLETFTVRFCKWVNANLVEIHAPLLTTFLSEPNNFVEEYDYSIVIVAPRLNKFTCDHGLPEKFILDGSSIISASVCSEAEPNNLGLLRNIGIRVRNLLNEFISVEELELSQFIVEVLTMCPPLFRHDKLSRLEMIDGCNLEQLFEFLHAAPSLKFLSINIYELADYDYGVMECIPSCIVSHLEEVRLSDFYTETRYYNLAKFFMENGEQLKKLCIVDYPPNKKPEELKELLLTFPKCSPSLEIDVEQLSFK